jgi:hypothetical protein
MERHRNSLAGSYPVTHPGAVTDGETAVRPSGLRLQLSTGTPIRRNRVNGVARRNTRKWHVTAVRTVLFVTNPTAATAEMGICKRIGCGPCPPTFGRIGTVLIVYQSDTVTAEMGICKRIGCSPCPPTFGRIGKIYPRAIRGGRRSVLGPDRNRAGTKRHVAVRFRRLRR